MYWRNSSLNETIGPIERPESHPLDCYMTIEKLSSETDFDISSKIFIPKFKVHNFLEFGRFINSINKKLGRRVYFSIEELYHLGIVINLEIGYLIHVSSTTDLSNNFVFSLTVDVKEVLAGIIEYCDYGGSPKAELDLVFRWVKLLYTENDMELIDKKRPKFPIEYNLCLYEDDEILKTKTRSILSVYQEPDPLLPIYSSYQCEFCLKSFENIRFLRSHINDTHDIPEKMKSIDFISPSFSQKVPVGLVTVLVSSRFLEYQKLYQPSLKTKLIPYEIPETFPILKEEESIIQNNLLGYTVNEVSDFDEMFSFNYIIKFINNLQVSDFNYYLDYLKMDSTYMRMNKFLTNLIFNCIVWKSKLYEYDTTLSTHRDKLLKFYISYNIRPSFIFNKLTNAEKIMKYSKVLTKSLLILLASYNLKRMKLPITCELPNYKVHFKHKQKQLLNLLFSFLLKKYKGKHPVMFMEDQIKDDKFEVHLENDEIQFWNNLSDLLIDITLQPKSSNTPIQTIFSFATCEYDYLNKQLKIFRPPKRGQLYRGLLYIIRLSFLSKVTRKTDEYYSSLIVEATLNGELRRIIEKMYYPTLYYYLKKKSSIMQPFFNPEKFTYVHPVYLFDKFVGCKILGLYSVNLMLNKTIEFLAHEFEYIGQLNELDYKFDDNKNKLLRKIMELENKNQSPDKTDDDYVEQFISKELKRSLTGITCLLIGYLLLTNKPLKTFKSYVEILYESFSFHDDYLEINSEYGPLFVEDIEIITYFRKYQLMRSLLLKTDIKANEHTFFMNFDHVKAMTFFDLMSCKYSYYRHFYAFLKAAHERNGKFGIEYSKDWIKLIRSQLRERSEGYLVINLKLIALDHQKYVGDNYIDTVDPRSYISFDNNLNLKDIIESGFLDYEFEDTIIEDDDVEGIYNDTIEELDLDLDLDSYSEENNCRYLDTNTRKKDATDEPPNKKVKSESLR